MAYFVGTTISHQRGAASALNLFRDYPVDERTQGRQTAEWLTTLFCPRTCISGNSGGRPLATHSQKHGLEFSP